MSGIAKLIGTSGVIFAIAMASIAQASPTGTPAANRVPTGKGKNLGGLFDNMVGRHDGDDASAGGGKSRPRRKHFTNQEWHDAYIAKHGHDLPSPLDRPGGH